MIEFEEMYKYKVQNLQIQNFKKMLHIMICATFVSLLMLLNLQFPSLLMVFTRKFCY